MLDRTKNVSVLTRSIRWLASITQPMSQGDPEICHTLSNIFMNLGTPVCPGHYLIKQRPIIFYVLGILSLRYSLEKN